LLSSKKQELESMEKLEFGATQENLSAEFIA
jgi:hypothetical protein